MARAPILQQESEKQEADADQYGQQRKTEGDVEGEY
jgi:hypothetical protein